MKDRTATVLKVVIWGAVVLMATVTLVLTHHFSTCHDHAYRSGRTQIVCPHRDHELIIGNSHTLCRCRARQSERQETP